MRCKDPLVFQADPFNCGGCGSDNPQFVCNSDEECISGHCTKLECSPEQQITSQKQALSNANQNPTTNGAGTNGIGCNNQCCYAPANGSPVCNNDICGFTCNTGFTQCSNECIDTSSDASNCGACGHACTADQTCSDGTCKPKCPTGQADCNGQCIDLSDPKSCGTTCDNLIQCAAPTGGTASCVAGDCKQTCPDGQVLMNGACAPCPSGQTACDNQCLDLTNPQSCGTSTSPGQCTIQQCQNPTDGTAVCSNGQCSTTTCTLNSFPPGPGIICNGACSPPASNANCGRCDRQCNPETQICNTDSNDPTGFSCQPKTPPCPTPGQQLCQTGTNPDGTPHLSCVDTLSNPDRCGSCTNVCNVGGSNGCINGVCCAQVSRDGKSCCPTGTVC
jgi:hypothetical protein